jgi:hypothetical protein
MTNKQEQTSEKVYLHNDNRRSGTYVFKDGEINPSDSRMAFEAHTVRKLKLRSPSVDDEFVSHLMARSGDNYKLSVINDKWDDWQSATQYADR